jgi:hypothetical protein
MQQHLLTIALIILSLCLCYGIGYCLEYPNQDKEKNIILNIVMGFAAVFALIMLIGLCWIIYTGIYDFLIYYNITI